MEVNRSMRQEDKQLLLVDLCARLPYNVWVSYKTKYDDIERATNLNGNYVRDIMEGTSSWIDFKPYLRPMSSMTEEEQEEYHSLCFEEEREVFEYGEWVTRVYYHDTVYSIDWLNKKMFDYRGLIPRGLANSTEKSNPYNEDYDSR